MGFGISRYLPVIVYFVSVVMLLGTVLYRREIGLYYVVGLLPMRNLVERMHEYPFGDDIVDMFVVTLGLLCLFGREDRGGLRGSVTTKPVVLYILLTYIYLWVGSWVVGVGLPLSLDDPRVMNWKNHMILPVLYLITVTIVREKRQIVGMFSVMVVSMFLIGMHFYRNFQHTGGQYREDRRWSGALSYLGPNEVGAFWAEYSFILLGVLLVCTLKFWRWPILATLGVSVYGLVYSFSRGAYAAFLVGFLFISLVSRNVKALAVLGGFLLFWTSLVPGSVVERVEMSRSEDGTLDSTLEGRLGRWQHGIDLFLRNPVGYGFETVRFLGFTGYLEVGSSGGDPHNRYIEFLVEMGVVGIVMFLYLFYLGFKSGWRLYTRGEDKFLKGLGLGFAATVVATMVANMFGDRWTYDILGAFYWVCWALVVRGNVIDQVGKAKAMAFPTSGEI